MAWGGLRRVVTPHTSNASDQHCSTHSTGCSVARLERARNDRDRKVGDSLRVVWNTGRVCHDESVGPSKSLLAGRELAWILLSGLLLLVLLAGLRVHISLSNLENRGERQGVWLQTLTHLEESIERHDLSSGDTLGRTLATFAHTLREAGGEVTVLADLLEQAAISALAAHDGQAFKDVTDTLIRARILLTRQRTQVLKGIETRQTQRSLLLLVSSGLALAMLALRRARPPNRR